MRARQLEVFTAVMRAGSVTGAARMLNISQPALSQILRHLEDELGFLLFAREKGRLQATPEALELFPQADRLSGELEGLRRKAADLKLGRTGLVRVGASTPPAMSILPRVFLDFRARHPGVALRSVVAPLQSLLVMLREGDTAMAIALSDRADTDTEIEVLGRTQFCCLLPEGHELGAMQSIGFGDLAGEYLMSYRGGTQPYDELDQAARSAGQVFAPTMEIDNSISVVGFVQAGLGVALVDALLPWDQFPGVLVRPLAEEPSLPLSLFSLRGRNFSQAEVQMRAQIKMHCSALEPAT
ncbi:MAG: LysR family transcriptional regulator [Pseudomonadota bacterium]